LSEELIRVLFLNAPFNMNDQRFRLSRLSIGQQAIASNLGDHISVMMRDASQMTREELRDLLSSWQPHHVGVTLYEHLLAETKELLAFIKECSPSILTSIGGPMATLSPKVSLAHCRPDFLFMGEAEKTFGEMLSIVGTDPHFRSSSSAIAALWEVEGLCLLDSRGGLIANTKKPRFSSSELDELPLRLELAAQMIGESTYHLNSSRGCPYQCIFCSKVHGSRYRSWSADRTVKTVAEIASLSESGRLPHIEKIIFHDDDFFIDRKRTLSILKSLAGARHQFTYMFQSNIASFFRGGEIDTEVLDALSALKVGNIRLGTESLNHDELVRLHKPCTDVRQIMELTEELHRRGIQSVHYLILSNPWTTAKDLLESMFNATEMMLRFGCLFTINPYIAPVYGSPFYDRLIRENIPFSGRMIKADGKPELDYRIGAIHHIFDLLVRRTVLDVQERRCRNPLFTNENPSIYLSLLKKHLDREKKRRSEGAGDMQYDFDEVDRYWKTRRKAFEELRSEMAGKNGMSYRFLSSSAVTDFADRQTGSK